MSAKQPLAIGLMVIGDEILSGKRQDKHFAQVCDILAKRGLSLAWLRVLGDDPVLLERELARSFADGGVVLSCGGIGATPDDHTRQCAARALGVPLVLHPEGEALIMQRIADNPQLGEPNSPANQHRLKMAEFPQGADIVPNPYNKIPGFSIQQHYFVPGFPEMAWPMIAWVFDHHYPDWHGDMAEFSLWLPHVAESEITPTLERLEAEFPLIRVFSLPTMTHPEHGRCIEAGVKGPREQAQAAFDALKIYLHQIGAT